MSALTFVLVLVVLWAIAPYLKRLWLRPFSLDGKVVIITGGGCGMGRGLAEKIWETTAKPTLVLLDLDTTALAATKTHLEQINTKSGRVLTFRCDVSNESDVASCIAQVKEAIAPQQINVLVNNAGIVHGDNIVDLTSAQLQRIFGVNVFAHFYLVKHVLSSMKQSDVECLIVSVASLFSFLPGCKLADYAATKAAVYSFHGSLRLELLRDGFANKIRTLIVCPLGVSTGMFDGMFEADHGLFNIQKHLAPILTPDEAVSSIHKAMIDGEQEVISCHPGTVGRIVEWFIPAQRLLPVPAQVFMASTNGTLHGMDSFVGHKKK